MCALSNLVFGLDHMEDLEEMKWDLMIYSELVHAYEINLSCYGKLFHFNYFAYGRLSRAYDRY